jgi:hypothetical protein
MSGVLALTQDLIARRSVTPEDAGCQDLLAARLAQAGFAIEHLPFGPVRNLWATHGRGGPVLVFLGHTDVVPSGPVGQWTSDPFVPTIRDGVLYGRGAADMKGSVAAFVVALEQFVAAHPDHAGTVAVLLTSDEEGDAIDGVRKVMEVFRDRGQRIDWCVTGEPSSKAVLGDLLRIGRRGTLSGTLTVRGPEVPDRPERQVLDRETGLRQSRRQQVLAAGVLGRDRASRDQVLRERQHPAHFGLTPKRCLKSLSVKPTDTAPSGSTTTGRLTTAGCSRTSSVHSGSEPGDLRSSGSERQVVEALFTSLSQPPSCLAQSFNVAGSTRCAR